MILKSLKTNSREILRGLWQWAGVDNKCINVFFLMPIENI